MNSRRSFTLIELLVVVGIMGLLAALSVPAVRSLMSSSTLSSNGNVLVGSLDLALQTAISQNEPTALVAITQGATSTDDNYRTFALFRLDHNASINASTASSAWTQVTPWRQLPERVAFSSEAAGTGLTGFFGVQSASLPFTGGAAPVILRGSSANRFSYLVFMPSGQLYASDGASGANPLTSPAFLTLIDPHSASGTSTNFYKIILNQNTGRSKIVRP